MHEPTDALASNTGVETRPSSEEVQLRPEIAMGMRYHVWVGPERLRLKQGVRRLDVSLGDIQRFGVRRVSEGDAPLTELRLVTARRIHKLPFKHGDAEGERLLACLRERRPEADVGHLSWGEAAPLLGLKPFGWGEVLRHRWVAVGLALALLAPAGMSVAHALFPPGPPETPATRVVATVIVMIGGVVAAAIGVMKVRARWRAERAASESRGLGTQVSG